MKQSLYRGLFACLSLSVLASCQDYDGGFSEEQIKKAAYDKHFEKTFGKVDPNQDWSMAQQVTAAINVPQVKGNAKVYLFDGIPNDPAVHILAENEMNGGKAAFRFDALKGVKSVYVAVMQEGKSVFSGTFSVDKSTLAIGEVKEMLAEMEMSQILTRSFSSSCPTTIKDVKEDLFTNIVSDVSKYKFNGNFYTLAELRAWAQAEYEAGRVTVDNYSTTTPFTNCVAGGSYDFAGATLASSVISVPAEGGYIFNGTYYTLTELRNYAQGLADNETININNYGSVPFNSDCVIPQGADWSNPQIDPTKVNAIVDKDGYWCKLNGNFGAYTLDEIKDALKDVSANFAYGTLLPLDWKSMVPEGTADWQVTKELLDWSKAQVDLTQAGYYAVTTGDIIWWPQGSSTYQKNTEAEIIDIVRARGTSDYTPLLESSILKPAHLDFTNATVKESDANISLVAPGNSFIYNNTVYADESALRSYTIAQNLGNTGPYLNCFSGSGLDFSSATVDESKAPLTPVTFDIDLTYLNNVETEAATPWTRGWGYSLYGPKGFFMEQCNYYGDPSVGNMAGTFNKYTSLYGSTDSERRELLDKIEAGFKIKSKGGVIELPFVYGATSIVDQFGYVFYKDGEDPLQQPVVP